MHVTAPGAGGRAKLRATSPFFPPDGFSPVEVLARARFIPDEAVSVALPRTSFTSATTRRPGIGLRVGTSPGRPGQCSPLPGRAWDFRRLFFFPAASCVLYMDAFLQFLIGTVRFLSRTRSTFFPAEIMIELVQRSDEQRHFLHCYFCS